MFKNKYFKTDNFYLAAFLFACGCDLVNIDKTINKKRAFFIFVDSPHLNFLRECFNFAKANDVNVCLDARKFIVAIKQLKERLYQDDI